MRALEQPVAVERGHADECTEPHREPAAPDQEPRHRPHQRAQERTGRSAQINVKRLAHSVRICRRAPPRCATPLFWPPDAPGKRTPLPSEGMRDSRSGRRRRRAGPKIRDRPGKTSPKASVSVFPRYWPTVPEKARPPPGRETLRHRTRLSRHLSGDSPASPVPPPRFGAPVKTSRFLLMTPAPWDSISAGHIV